MKTKLCIVCGSVATKWGGHVHVDDVDKEEISAGWCDDHEESPIYLTENPVMTDDEEWNEKEEDWYAIKTECTETECYGEYRYDIIDF